MLADSHDVIIDSSASEGVNDSQLQVEFVEIYEANDGDLAMARNCSNG